MANLRNSFQVFKKKVNTNGAKLTLERDRLRQEVRE